jgi:hypothetical protein
MPECDGCGDCCGPVQASTQETIKIAAFIARRGLRWKEDGNPLTCGFFDNTEQRCRIYSVRPISCRMYGVVKEMACPHYPQAVRVSFPARAAIRCGVAGIRSPLLAQSFGEAP